MPENNPQMIADETPPPAQVDEMQSLSESADLFKIPLVESQNAPSTTEPKESTETPQSQQVTSKSESPTPDKSQSESVKESAKESPQEFKPIYEGEKSTEAPFKSKEAEEIRQMPPPKGVHAKNWNEARTKWAGIVEAKDSALHKAQKEHQEALAALVKRNEDMEKRISSLVGYESVIDFQSTDKFKKEIEEPLSRAESSLIEWTKTWATPEGLKELTDNIKNSNYLDGALLELQKTRPDIALRFQMHMGKILDLNERKTAALNEVKTNHQKFVDERRGESAKKMANFEMGIKSSIESHTKMFDNNTPMFPFLVKQRVPSGASPQIQAQVETHNKQVEENIRDLEAAVKSEDPNLRVRLGVGYMTAVHLTKINEQLRAELQKEREFNTKVREKSAPPNASGGVAPSKEKEFEGSLSEYLDYKAGRNQ